MNDKNISEDGYFQNMTYIEVCWCTAYDYYTQYVLYSKLGKYSLFATTRNYTVRTLSFFISKLNRKFRNSEILMWGSKIITGNLRLELIAHGSSESLWLLVHVWPFVLLASSFLWKLEKRCWDFKDYMLYAAIIGISNDDTRDVPDPKSLILLMHLLDTMQTRWKISRWVY